MNNAAFTRAAVPEPYRILGRKMLPFLLGHEILFQRFGVAYSIEKPGDPEYSDLIVGVFICSRTPRQAIQEMRSRAFPAKLWCWGKVCGAFDVFDKFRLFRDYLNEGRDIPQIFEKDQSRVQKTSMIEGLYAMLRAKQGKSHDEAMNTELWPLIRSLVAQGEAEGRVDVYDPETDGETAKAGQEFLNEILSGKHFSATQEAKN